MATAKQVLDKFRSQLGVKESPSGSNKQKFGAWFGMNGAAWCNIFVSWCFSQLGSLALIGGKQSYTPTSAKWFYDHKQWGTTPKVGAIVYFNFGTHTPGRWLGIEHVGIVEAILPDGRIQTIEGNTSAGSNANGGQVQRRQRARSLVAGYGYPKYDTAAPVAPKVAPKAVVPPVEKVPVPKPVTVPIPSTEKHVTATVNGGKPSSAGLYKDDLKTLITMLSHGTAVTVLGKAVKGFTPVRAHLQKGDTTVGKMRTKDIG